MSDNFTDRGREKVWNQSTDGVKVRSTNRKPNDCGECSACCAVPSLVVPGVKALGQVCPQLLGGPDTGGRCIIYDKRPERCHEFFCLWAHEEGGWMLDAQRPDKSGLMITASRAWFNNRWIPAPVSVVWELRPAALDGWWADRTLKKLISARATFIKRLDGTTELLGPPRIVATIQKMKLDGV